GSVIAMEKQQFRLGLVGYGEIGSTVGAGLRNAGLESIACYDKYAFDGPFADLIQTRAKEFGVTLVRSNQELADAADVIVSVTPGSASLESADAFAPCLTGRHVFADFASATHKIVAARLRWKEGLGLKDHFKGVVPADYKQALDAIETKMAER